MNPPAKTLQRAFHIFDETIRLSNDNDDLGKQPLRDARETVVTAVREGLTTLYSTRDESKPTFTDTVQGSYALATGIGPTGKRDYDVDLALAFNIDHQDERWKDPTTLKLDVIAALEEALPKGAVVEMMHPCVRVVFADKNLHVDLACYAVGGNGQHLARGYKGSGDERKYWAPSEPKVLAEKLQWPNTDSKERDQYRRVIRAFKRWKDLHFPESGEASPPGVGLTMLVRDAFRPTFKVAGEANDLKALRTVVDYAVGRFQRVLDSETQTFVPTLTLPLPTLPRNNVFDRMSSKQMEAFHTKLTALQAGLREAANASDPADAADMLRKYFGDDFPTVKSTAAKLAGAVIGTSHSG